MCLFLFFLFFFLRERLCVLYVCVCMCFVNVCMYVCMYVCTDDLICERNKILFKHNNPKVFPTNEYILMREKRKEKKKKEQRKMIGDMDWVTYQTYLQSLKQYNQDKTNKQLKKVSMQFFGGLYSDSDISGFYFAFFLFCLFFFCFV